jgi:hypothetical protein
MNEPDTSKIPDSNELDAAQVEAAAAGGECSPEAVVGITESLIEAYENLVDFTSHVIGRVAGES